MIEQANRSDRPITGWRLKVGIVLFVISTVVPLVGIPFVAGLGLSGTMVTSVSGAMLIGPELLGVAAVAVMGKPGYLYIKNRVFSFLKHYGPPKEVSRTRYNIGLVMFCVPIVFGWLSPYVADSTSISEPTTRILPSLSATASAQGCAQFAV